MRLPVRLAATGKGTLDLVATFQTDSLKIEVATYTDPENAPYKVGLIGLAAGSQRNSFAFTELDECKKLTDLVAKAAKTQPTGSTWSVIGEVTEKGSSDVSHIVISAGAGIRFALNSPKGASLTYVLARSDIPAFQNALGKVRAYLTM